MLRTSGILYRAALLPRKMPSVTFRQCHLTWLRYGSFTTLSVAEKREFSSIDSSVVEAVWTVIEPIREFMGVNSYNYAAKYVLQVFVAYPNNEYLRDDFWLQPPDWPPQRRSHHHQGKTGLCPAAVAMGECFTSRGSISTQYWRLRCRLPTVVDFRERKGISERSDRPGHSRNPSSY
jgi:hypothetical protein